MLSSTVLDGATTCCYRQYMYTTKTFDYTTGSACGPLAAWHVAAAAAAAAAAASWEEQLVSLRIPAKTAAAKLRPLTLRATLCEQSVDARSVRRTDVMGVCEVAVDPALAGVVGPIEMQCQSANRGVLLAFSMFAEF